MKKGAATFLLAGVLATLLVACGVKSENEESGTSVSQKPAQTATVTSPAATQEAETKQAKVSQATGTKKSAVTQETEKKQAEATQATETKKPEAMQTAESKQPEATQAADTLTQDQALKAIKNYCYINNADLKDMEDSEEYTIYWEVSTNENKEIVVLYRSYTGAQIHYYINASSGDTYVTEFVPGITDDEEITGERFNVRDYLR